MRIQRRINDEAQKSGGLGVLGKIKIGEMVATGNGKNRPTSLDYFRVDAPEQYARFFRDYYSDKPNKITVVFLSNDMNEVCKNYYELRDSSGGRLAYGDGNTFFVATKQGDSIVKDVVTTPQNPKAWMSEAEQRSGGKWRERLVLRFAIPALPILGVWEFSTHGNNSTIPNIVGTIDTMLEMAGRIAGIPFDLIVEKVKSDKAGSKSVYPVVKIIPNISPESAEVVRGLPMQLGAILTQAKIAELSTGESKSIPAIIEPVSEYEEIESVPKPTAKERAEAQFKKFVLETVENYTKAAHLISTMADGEVQVACAKMLGDKAQKAGFQFDKQSKSYK